MEQSVSRRSFIEGAGLAAVAAGVGVATASQARAEEAGEPAWDYETDVVVVGYGGAGPISAITAYDNGAEVIILEKQAQDTEDQGHQTNSTRMSHSCTMDFKDERGAYDFLKVACRDQTPDDVIKEFAKYCVGTAAWVNGIGGTMYESEDDNSEYPFETVPEGANYVAYLHEGFGHGLFATYEKAVEERGIQVLFETPAQRLITDDSGAVIGVVATQGDTEVRLKARKGVILACGGFEFDFEMQKAYIWVNPCRFDGNPDNTGDGIKMAQEVGADLWHMANVGGRPCAFYDKVGHGIDYSGKPDVWVDKYGRRFTGGGVSVNNFTPGTLPSHTSSYSCFKWDFEKADFAAAPFWTIFDQSIIDGGGVNLLDNINLITQEYEWSEGFEQEVADGFLLRAETLEELAEAIAQDPENGGKMDTATFVDTITKFNEYCEAGEDPEFHVVGTGLTPVVQAPFYALKMYPGNYNTFGGPRRDPRGRIVNVRGEVIPGLFGAGELGSVLGFLYIGGGWNICEQIASGRIAGEEAAAQEARA